MDQPPPLNGGQHLYRAGDDLGAVFAVRSGTFKLYAFDGNGREQVVGFAIAGEFVGLDAIYAQRHATNAIALTDSSVCALRYSALVELMASVAGLRRQIFRLAGNDLGNHHAALTSELDARRRVARFLLDLARRNGNGDRVAATFELPMALDEIANYLRLAAEAVAGAFSELRGTGLVALDRQTVQLPDPEALQSFVLAAG